MKQHDPITIDPNTDFYIDDRNDKPPLFDEEMAIAWLMALDGPLVMLDVRNSEGKPIIVLCVNCSDVFAWGCADFEPLPLGEVEGFVKMYREIPGGSTRWCCIRRNQQPQPPVKRTMIERGEWDEVLEALPKNTMDREVHEMLGIKYHKDESPAPAGEPEQGPA